MPAIETIHRHAVDQDAQDENDDAALLREPETEREPGERQVN